MRSICFSVALVCLAQAQQLPNLDPAIGVDVNVTSVEWHPYGSALMYTKPEPQGKAIGLFAWGGTEGQVVLRVNEKDRVKPHWFENQPFVTLIVYRDIVRSDLPYIEASIFLADARNGEIFKLWAEEMPTKDGISVSVDTSPKYRHAIFRVRLGQQDQHLVLPAGGKRLIPARELDRAIADGFDGPSWSVDGTAVYAKGAGNLATSLTSSRTDDVSYTTATFAFQEALLTKSISLKEDVTFDVSRLWIKRPTPEVGAAVLELMPSNSVLRQIRFKGEWQYPKASTDSLALLSRDSTLQLGQTTSIANSLWLVMSKDRQKNTGVLVAAHSDKGWLAPWNSGVAYRTDGALFVRSFKRAD